MNPFAQDDLDSLAELRSHLKRVTECSERSGGLTYYDEIKSLDRIIEKIAQMNDFS